MSFDGIFLHKLMQEFNILKTGRITKIMESGNTDFILTIRVNHQNYTLMLGLSSEYARIHLTTKKYDFPDTPRSLTMLLRKHIEGYFIEDIYQYQNDRIVVFCLAGYSEMKDFTKKYLICEIMGRYSNLILTDENYSILEVLKHAGVTEFGRTMLAHATYQFPTSVKKNPFTLSYNDLLELNISSPKELCRMVEGVSIAFANYVYAKGKPMEVFYHAIHQQDSLPSIFETTSGKKDFYFFPLEETIIMKFDTLSSLLDYYYYDIDNQSKIKLKTHDLINIIEKQIQKNERKLKKLSIEQLEALQAEEYKIKGELLLSYPQLKSKEEKVSVFNYYTNEYETIALDEKYDVITNSQKFYKKYQKLKTAMHYIQEQTQLATDEIEYFQMLLEQLKCASINDALEIRQELIDNRYILNTKEKQKKKNKPNYLTYIVDGINIYVGKNNLQNEYLTHKLAKPLDYWFHIKGGSGSHVIVSTNELSENLIRTAAMLAAHYSSFQDSSSIPVDYTQVKYIKKIPGKRNCFVTYSKQKTIYIDIDKNLVESLRIKK